MQIFIEIWKKSIKTSEKQLLAVVSQESIDFLEGN